MINIGIYGAFFTCGTDKVILGYFVAHCQAFYPWLPGRSQAMRKAASLCRVKELAQQRLARAGGQAADPLSITDTLPPQVRGYAPSRRDRCFRPSADYGHSVANKLRYYDFESALGTARSSLIIGNPLVRARPYDIHLLDKMAAAFVGIAPADAGFLDGCLHHLLTERDGVFVVTLPCQGARPPHPRWLLRSCNLPVKGAKPAAPT